MLRFKDSIRETDFRANPMPMNEITTQHTYYAHIDSQTPMEAVHEETDPDAKDLLLSLVVSILKSGKVRPICNFNNSGTFETGF